jgi:hypothetical protein
MMWSISQWHDVQRVPHLAPHLGRDVVLGRTAPPRQRPVRCGELLLLQPRHQQVEPQLQDLGLVRDRLPAAEEGHRTLELVVHRGGHRELHLVEIRRDRRDLQRVDNSL